MLNIETVDVPRDTRRAGHRTHRQRRERRDGNPAAYDEQRRAEIRRQTCQECHTVHKGECW